MTQITALVKSAMGFDQARGDQVQVTNMQFARIDAGDGTPAPKPLLGLDSSYWFKIIEAAILCVTALLIGLFVARPLISRMFAAQARRPRQHGRAGQRLAGRRRAAGARPRAGTAPPQPTARRRSRCPRPIASIDISRIEGQVRESSIKKVGEVVARASRRSAGDHPHLAASTGLRPWPKPPKPPSRKISAPSPGAERAAIIMLSLGEEHSAKIWQMMDEEEIKEISQVMSNLGSVSSDRGREAAGRFRLADVGHRLADGLL